MSDVVMAFKMLPPSSHRQQQQPFCEATRIWLLASDQDGVAGPVPQANGVGLLQQRYEMIKLKLMNLCAFATTYRKANGTSRDQAGKQVIDFARRTCTPVYFHLRHSWNLNLTACQRLARSPPLIGCRWKTYVTFPLIAKKSFPAEESRF